MKEITMMTRAASLAVFILGLLWPNLRSVAATPVVIDDFEGKVLTWKPVRLALSKDHPEYVIGEEKGNHFLHAAPQKGEEGKIIYKRFAIDLEKTPVLRWRWRALSLPENAGTNDSAAGVYVYLQKGPLRRILKYIWSTKPVPNKWTQSAGSIWLAKTRIKVLRIGPPLNEWVEETVNVRKDFKEAYDSDAPDRSEGVGVLTDGDQTNSVSSADYDDFVVLPGTP